MSVSLNLFGIPQPPTTTAVTTAGVDIAVPIALKAVHVLIGVRIVNIDAAATNRVGLYWTDGSAVDHQFFNDIVAADDSIIVEDPIVFSSVGTARKIRAVAQNNGDILVTTYFAVQSEQPKGA